MFKSVFAKYVTTFMTLLLISFLLLLFIVNSVFANDAIRAEQQDMQGVSVACARDLSELYIESCAAGDAAGDFAAFLQGKTGSSEEVPAVNTAVRRVLRAVMTNFEDMTVFVTDARGGFIFSMGKTEDHAPAVGALLLPESHLGEAVELQAEGAFLEPDLFCEHLRNHGETLVHTLPVCDGAGEIVGHVLVTSTAETRTTLMETTLRSVAVAGLWIMLAALVAIYFTTERIIGPLRDMSRAAKKLMVGQFDVRVRVRGKDEVTELAVAFNQMADALESLDRMRTSFVANVSHDLRTPMTTIAGFIDGILDGVIPPDEHAHYLKVVSNEVQRLSRLVTALLDVSRLQTGDRKFDKKPFDVCEMGRQILISFEQKIDEKQLDVEFLCADERMYALADRDAIHQILYNICDNAVKFAYEGGRLRMSFDTIGDSPRNRKIIVKVYNEGPGIPPEDMPFIFERFYKSDKSRSLDKTGVGLGMFIAKTIIEAHGETISVSGEYGRDCEFTFTLAPTDSPRPHTNSIEEAVK